MASIFGRGAQRGFKALGNATKVASSLYMAAEGLNTFTEKTKQGIPPKQIATDWGEEKRNVVSKVPSNLSEFPDTVTQARKNSSGNN